MKRAGVTGLSHRRAISEEEKKKSEGQINPKGIGVRSGRAPEGEDIKEKVILVPSVYRQAKGTSAGYRDRELVIRTHGSP